MTERIITDSNGRKHITNEAKMVFSRQIWIIVKGAVFVLMNAGPGR